MNYRLLLQSAVFVLEGLLLVLLFSAALHFEVARLVFGIAVAVLCLIGEIFCTRRSKNRPRYAAGAVQRGGVKVTHRHILGSRTTRGSGGNEPGSQPGSAPTRRCLFRGTPDEKFARPARGNDKGKVENLVGTARRNFMVPLPRAASWEALNEQLARDCLARRAERLRGHKETIGERCDRGILAHGSLQAFDPLLFPADSQRQSNSEQGRKTSSAELLGPDCECIGPPLNTVMVDDNHIDTQPVRELNLSLRVDAVVDRDQ